MWKKSIGSIRFINNVGTEHCTSTGRAAGAVVFEHLYPLIRPYLVRSDDWMDPDSLFRQLQQVINRPKRRSQAVPAETVMTFFTELNAPPSVDMLPLDD